jgi:uncharacterized membrane protein HdeD (DUF308 family)
MALILASRWWSLLIRGIVAILFGILCFVWPGLSLYSLVLLFGVYAIMDGAFNLVLAFRLPRDAPRWGMLLLEGILGIAAGVLTFVWPNITALVLLYLIAAWAIVTGIMEIAAAIRLRKLIRGEWLLGLLGLLSVVFGVLLFAYPGAGALALVYWIGAYAVVFGILMAALALRLRAWANDLTRRMPVDRAPAPV